MSLREHGPGVIIVLARSGRAWILPAANMRDRARREFRDHTIAALIPTRNHRDAGRLNRRLQARFFGRIESGINNGTLSPGALDIIRRYARFVNGIRDREIGGGERRRQAQLARRDGTSRQNSNEFQSR